MILSLVLVHGLSIWFLSQAPTLSVPVHPQAGDVVPRRPSPIMEGNRSQTIEAAERTHQSLSKGFEFVLVESQVAVGVVQNEP